MTTTPPAHVADLLRRLTNQGGRPCVTWYGPDGERVEFSSAVIENWVAKTTNLLVEEFDVSSSCEVAIDVIPHWRTLVWALASWRTGATVLPGNSGDVVVTTSPGTAKGTDVVAVALPALARRFDGDLPASAIDAASAVMTYGDGIGWTPETDTSVTALGGTEPITYAELMAAADSAASDVESGTRVLIEAPARDLGAWLLRVLGILGREGSLVLASPDVAAQLRDDAPRRERLVATERVDADLLG